MLSLWKDAAAGVRVLRLTQPEEIARLVGLFEQVAAAEGWQPEGALQRFRQCSVYFALEVNGEIAGGLQLALPDGSATLPCQTLWPEVTVSAPGRCAHVTMLALAKQFRGRSLLFWPMVIEMWRHCVGAGIATLFIEVTPRVLPLYRRLGWPLAIQGKLRPHWGEDCYLCCLGIAEVAQALLERAEHSGWYRQIVAQAFRVRLATESAKPLAARVRAERSGALPACGGG